MYLTVSILPLMVCLFLLLLIDCINGCSSIFSVGTHALTVWLCSSSRWEVRAISSLKSPHFLRPKEDGRSDDAEAVLSTEDLGAAPSWSSASCHVNEPKVAYWIMRQMALSPQWPQPTAGSQPTWQLAMVACVSPAKTVRTAQLSPAKIADLWNHRQLKMAVTLLRFWAGSLSSNI